MSVAVMVLALPASLAQHFELNWKLLILEFCQRQQKKRKKKKNRKKNLLPRLPSSPSPNPQRTVTSVSVHKTSRKTWFQWHLLHLFCSLTSRFKGDFFFFYPAGLKSMPSHHPSPLIAADGKFLPQPPLPPPPPPSLRRCAKTRRGDSRDACPDNREKFAVEQTPAEKENKRGFRIYVCHTVILRVDRFRKLRGVSWPLPPLM